MENPYKHRVQIRKAQDYIRKNLSHSLSLEEIAQIAGASKYHFIRIFYAYLGETPLEYARRQKIEIALQEILEAKKTMTDIAFDLGFESSSSLNKLFKKLTNLNPSEFRNLGKADQNKIIYNISTTKRMEEILMKLNLSQEPQIIERPEVTILSHESKGGRFEEIATPVWEEFLKTLENGKQDLSQSEFLGLSLVDQNENHYYKAAITVPQNVEINLPSLKREVLAQSKYAKFILKGSYDGVWPAFDFAFKKLNEMGIKLEDSPCLENYINDPRQTPEDELITEILIPIK